MRIIFTGTQKGTTEPQHESLEAVLEGHDPEVTEGVHGLSVGADEEFHFLCRQFGIPLRGHPGDLPDKRASIPASEFAVLLPPEPNLARNHTMISYAVLSSEKSQLLVCPKRDYEELRSGTWATVRYARRAGLDILYIWPSDGTLEPRSPGSPYYHSRNRHV